VRARGTASPDVGRAERVRGHAMLIANFRTRQVLHRLGHPLISAKLLDLAGPRPALDQGIPVMTSRRPIRGAPRRALAERSSDALIHGR